MITMTTYRLRPYMNQDEVKELMTAFAEYGSTAGTKAHYVFADGGGGVVIAENDNFADGYRNILNYTEWVEYETQTLLDIEEALPLIADALSG